MCAYARGDNGKLFEIYTDEYDIKEMCMHSRMEDTLFQTQITKYKVINKIDNSVILIVNDNPNDITTLSRIYTEDSKSHFYNTLDEAVAKMRDISLKVETAYESIFRQIDDCISNVKTDINFKEHYNYFNAMHK
jgi:hypothetical protein